MFNKSVSEVNVYIGRGTRKRSWVPVKRNVRIPHDRKFDIRVGHLPCLFVK